MTTPAVSPAQSSTRAASIVLLAADAVLAARPATPVQLAHACLQAGYGTVIPPSWGDELLATETIRQLQRREPRPVVFCACPHVSERLLGVGDDLTPFLLPLVPPPVAAARYLRHLAGNATLHITFVGRCPAGSDSSIDTHATPEAFLTSLARRGIELTEQPLVFDAVLPPDRRRHRSLPGGVPAPEVLWNQTGGWPLVEIDGTEPLTEFAQYLASGEGTLLDLSPTLQCTCSGAGADIPPRSARAAITSLEPPRSASDVIDVSIAIQLTRPVTIDPQARRNGSKSGERPSTEPSPDVELEPRGLRATPDVTDREATSTTAAGNHAPPTRRRSPPGGVRAVSSLRAATRSGEGRPLPRAYLARRRGARRSGVGARIAAGIATHHAGPVAATALHAPEASPNSPPSSTRESDAVETPRGGNGTSQPAPSEAPRAPDRPPTHGRLFASVPIAVTKPSLRESRPLPTSVVSRTEPPAPAERDREREVSAATTDDAAYHEPFSEVHDEPEPTSTPATEEREFAQPATPTPATEERGSAQPATPAPAIEARESPRESAPSAPADPAPSPRSRAGSAPDLMSEVRSALDDVAGLLDTLLGSVAGVVRDGLGRAGGGRPGERR